MNHETSRTNLTKISFCVAEGHTDGDDCRDRTSNLLLTSSLHHKSTCFHGEQAHRCLEQTQRQLDCPTRVLLLFFKIVWYREPPPLCTQTMIASMQLSHP